MFCWDARPSYFAPMYSTCGLSANGHKGSPTLRQHNSARNYFHATHTCSATWRKRYVLQSMPPEGLSFRFLLLSAAPPPAPAPGVGLADPSTPVAAGAGGTSSVSASLATFVGGAPSVASSRCTAPVLPHPVMALPTPAPLTAPSRRNCRTTSDKPQRDKFVCTTLGRQGTVARHRAVPCIRTRLHDAGVTQPQDQRLQPGPGSGRQALHG